MKKKKATQSTQPSEADEPMERGDAAESGKTPSNHKRTGARGAIHIN